MRNVSVLNLDIFCFSVGIDTMMNPDPWKWGVQWLGHMPHGYEGRILIGDHRSRQEEAMLRGC
jgi:hypothetical protein